MSSQNDCGGADRAGKRSTRVHLSPTCSLVGYVTRLSCDSCPDVCKQDVEVKARDIHTFLGIPFAMPPIGELRFKDPVAFPLWTGERTANEFGMLIWHI